MKKNKFIFFLLISASLCLYPCWADDRTILTNQSVHSNNSATTYGTIINTNAANKNTTSAEQKDTLPPSTKSQTTKCKLPKKVFSVATAFLIGTPVCVVRRTKYEEWCKVNGLIGDSSNKCKKVLAGIVCLPMAVVCGTGEAPFDALANSLMYPAFSKDQLSQGKLIQNN